jgi:predicted RNase H-like nuclease (RuvC/YqgF family)
MDDRKTVIKELEEKKRTLTESRNRLLQGLGESLLQRIGDGEPFSNGLSAGLSAGQAGGPGAVLAEYRRMRKEIVDSNGTIKSLELDIVRLKELEEKISAIESEQSLLKGELAQVQVRVGFAILKAPNVSISALFKNQEEALLAKIEEHEKTLEKLEEQGGGIFNWLGKNARTAVEKALLLKNRSDLEKLYLTAGTEYLSTPMAELSDEEAAKDAEKAQALKERVSSLAEELLSLKEERRKIGGVFGTESSPASRIRGFERRIAQITKEFPAVYLRLGLLAAASGGKDTFASFMNGDDPAVLEKAEALALQIAGEELSIRKINAAIRIDEEKAEIEKLKRAIAAQRQKITAAEDAITSLEEQISETERHIAELETFIQGDHGS